MENSAGPHVLSLQEGLGLRWESWRKGPPGVSVSYCCVTDQPKLGDSEQQPPVIAHTSVGLLGGSSAGLLGLSHIQWEGQWGWRAQGGLSHVTGSHAVGRGSWLSFRCLFILWQTRVTSLCDPLGATLKGTLQILLRLRVLSSHSHCSCIPLVKANRRPAPREGCGRTGRFCL